MDFIESDEQQMLRETVAKVAGDFGHDYFLEQVRSGGKAEELWAALSTAGFTGINVPEPYGAGQGMVELAIVTEETAAAGCPLLMFLVSPAICGEIIARFGSDDQQRRWLPGLGSGEEKMAFAITEPDAGSNSHRISTVATRDGSGWRLTGTKYYISGVDEAENLLVVARSGVDELSGRGELTLFVVPTSAAGLSRDLIDVQVTSTEKQFTLFFDDVAVSDEDRIGPVGGALRPLFLGLNPERIIAAATCNGIGRHVLAKAATYANEREVWGVPIGSHQGVAHPLAEASIALECARLMTTKAAWAFDAGLDAGDVANMAKVASADAALLAVDRAMQAHGGNGMATEYGLATLWGLARLLKVAPVSREMILNHHATHVLGLPRSY